MAYKRNYVRKHELSIGSLEDMIKDIQEKQASYDTVLGNIADRVADEMLKEVTSSKYKSKYSGNPYGNTKKAVEVMPQKAIAKIYNNDEKALFYEMGTGVVGAEYPALSNYYGWVYDHHGHGDEGWWYPTTEDDPNPYKWTDPSGQLRAWTKGLNALNGFYWASRVAEDRIEEISLEELKKV